MSVKRLAIARSSVAGMTFLQFILIAGCLALLFPFARKFLRSSVRVTQIGHPSPLLDRNLIAWAAAGGRMLLRVEGSPLGEPKERFGDRVADLVTGHYAGRHIRFTTSEEPGMRSEYRVILVFSDLPASGQDNICQAPDPLRGPLEEGAGLYLHGAFCHNGKPLKLVCGHINGLKQGDQGRLNSLVKHTIIELMPADTGSDH